MIDKFGGFSNNSVRLGFSEQTTLGTLEAGAFSKGPLACLLIPGLTSLLSNCMIRDECSLEVEEEVLDSLDAGAVDEGWKFEFNNCFNSWFLASSLFSEAGEEDAEGGDEDLFRTKVTVEADKVVGGVEVGGVDNNELKVDILGGAVDIMTIC